MPTERLNVKVLLAARLLDFAVEELAQRVDMLDGRDPSTRARLVAEHRHTIRAIATDGHDGADSALINALPHLEIIACFSAGMDAIDVAAAAERGIKVTNSSPALVDDVADVAIGKVVQLLRRFDKAEAYLRAGKWPTGGNFPLQRSPKGLKLGILGMGGIGAEIARRAEVMRMSVAYHNRSQKAGSPYRYVPSLLELAKDSDVLVVCCPATPETFHAVNAEVLEALGPTGLVVNIARGTVIDETALIAALQAGKLGGAGLDVFEHEPHVPAALLAMDNVVVTPHVGSATQQTRRAMCENMIGHIEAQFPRA